MREMINFATLILAALALKQKHKLMKKLKEHSARPLRNNSQGDFICRENKKIKWP